MNSPVRGEMKVKTDLDAFNELTTEHKASQEVNNNSTTALNNNTTAAAAISNNNSTIASNKNEPPVNATTVRGEQQAPIAPNTSLNSPSASSTNQISSNNNSSTNSQSSSTNSNSSNHQYSFEYWSQLMKDSKQLQTFSNLFMHVERLLDEEISRVRKALFQNNKFENAPLVLPEPEGPIVQKQEKVYVPIHEHPNYNFVGRILGPRGMTAKQLEQETGCKIMIRGKGSMRNKHMEDSNRGRPNWEHLSDDLHVLIIVEDSENRAKLKIERAVEEVKKLLVPVTEGEDELKKKQLMELAIINGTYKDSNTRLLENEQLKLLPQASPHHNALAVSQQHLTNLSHLPLTPQLHPALRQQSLNASHASNQAAMVATSTHHTTTGAATSISTPMGGLMMAARPAASTHPLLLGNYYSLDYRNSLSANRDNESLSGNGTSPAGTSAQAALLNQSHLTESSQQALAAAAAYLYPPPYDLSYAAQLSGLSGFIEYPMQSAMAAQVAVAAQEASSGKQRASLTGTGRDHPYQRPSSSTNQPTNFSSFVTVIDG